MKQFNNQDREEGCSCDTERDYCNCEQCDTDSNEYGGSHCKTCRDTKGFE